MVVRGSNSCIWITGIGQDSTCRSWRSSSLGSRDRGMGPGSAHGAGPTRQCCRHPSQECLGTFGIRRDGTASMRLVHFVGCLACSPVCGASAAAVGSGSGCWETSTDGIMRLCSIGGLRQHADASRIPALGSAFLTRLGAWADRALPRVVSSPERAVRQETGTQAQPVECVFCWLYMYSPWTDGISADNCNTSDRAWG